MASSNQAPPWSAPAFLPNQNAQQPNLVNPSQMSNNNNQQQTQLNAPSQSQQYSNPPMGLNNTAPVPQNNGTPADPNAPIPMSDGRQNAAPVDQQQQQQQNVQPFQFKADLFTPQNFQLVSHTLEGRTIPTKEERHRIAETITQQEQYRRLIEDKVRDLEQRLKERDGLVETNKQLEQKLHGLNSSYNQFLKTIHKNGNAEDHQTFNEISNAMQNFDMPLLNAGLQRTAVKASRAYTAESANADNLLGMSQQQGGQFYQNPMNSLFNQQPAGFFGQQQSPFYSQPNYQSHFQQTGIIPASQSQMSNHVGMVAASKKAAEAQSVFGVNPNDGHYFNINSMINGHAASGRVNMEGFNNPAAQFSTKNAYGIGINANSDRMGGY